MRHPRHLSLVTPAEAQGCPGNLIIGDLELVWVRSRLGFGGVNLRRFVDGSDGLAGEEAAGDEVGESDSGHGDAALAGGDAQQEIGDHGGDHLETDGVLGAPEEAAQFKMLLDPAEKQLDLPARFIKRGDGHGRTVEIVRDEGEDHAIVALQADATHRDGQLGMALGCEPDLGVVDNLEAIALGALDRPQRTSA